MTKLTIFLSILLFFISTVRGASLDFDARFDASGMTYNEAARNVSLGATQSRYYLKTARLDFQQAIDDKIKLRARLVLNTDQGAVNKRDSLNNSVDLFNITYPLGQPLELTVGKFSSDMGANEHQYPSPDVYLFTEAHSGASVNLNTVSRSLYASTTGQAASLFTWSGTGLVKYYTGAKLAYNLFNHKISLHTANLPADEMSGTNLNQTQTMTGVVYQGSFADQLLVSQLSFHDSYLPGATSGLSGARSQYTAAGLKLNLCDYVVDLDYLNNLYKSRTNVTVRGPQDDSIGSLSASVSSSFGQWTPRLKYEMSTLNVAGEKIFDVTGYGAAIEYRPVAEDNFRYHLAYNGKTYAPVRGDTLESQEIIAGLRIKADMLK